MSQRPRRTSVLRPERYRHDPPERPEQAVAAPVAAQPLDEGMDRSDRVRWGEMIGLDVVKEAVMAAHGTIMKWRKNFFPVPTSQHGKSFVAEVSRLLKLFNSKSPWESVALNQLMIFFPLMLQKPGPRTKTHDHNRYLSKRMQWWKDGKLQNLILEGKEIQKRLNKHNKGGKKVGLTRGFTRLMLEGKVKQALKLIDADNDVRGIHEVNAQVRGILQDKHPCAVEADPAVLFDGVVPQTQDVKK